MTRRWMALLAVLVMVLAFAVPGRAASGALTGGGGAKGAEAVARDAEPLPDPGISASPASLTLYRGGTATITLTPTGEDTGDMNFSVALSDGDDESIIEFYPVSHHLREINTVTVTGKKVGGVTLEILRSGYSTPLHVSVTVLLPPPPTYYPTKVTVIPDTAEMVEDDELELTVEVEPSYSSFKIPTWSSDHPEIAAVDADTGVVTARSLGEATITATVAGVTGTCAVTVGKRTQTGDIAIKTNVGAFIGDKGVRSISNSATPTFYLDNAPAGAEVEWSSSKPAVINVKKDTGVATLGKTKKQLNVATVITAKYDGKTYTATYKLRNAPTAIKVQYKNSKNKWVDITDANPLVLKPNVKCEFRVKSTAKLLPKQAAWRRWSWSSTDATVAKVGPAGTKIVAGPVDGTEAEIVFTTFDGVKCSAKIVVSAAKSIEFENDGALGGEETDPVGEGEDPDAAPADEQADALDELTAPEPEAVQLVVVDPIEATE